MILSRLWYVALALAIAALIVPLSLAQSMYNRALARSMGEGLSADSQVVSWYLRDDARKRSGQLVQFALDREIAATLRKASESETKLLSKYRDKVNAALQEINKEIPQEEGFDAVFAVDQHGRVVGHIGYPQASGMDDFELGGYPVVADALHGFIRDDTLVWDRVYRVVARPVEYEAGNEPAGAVIGARIIDDKFARELTERTGAAVAFYVGEQRTAAAAPEGFAKANLDQIVTDLDELAAEDQTYQEKGRSGIRELAGGTVGVQYTRLPGEAYELGAGFAVARTAESVDSLFGFFQAADDKDKESSQTLLAALVALAAIVIGIGFTILEHTRPLKIFDREASRLAKGEIDQLQLSKFGGIYRRIASELNDGIDKVAASQGGVSRKAADLGEVLGDLPAQPQMAAFSVPGGDAPQPGPQPPSAPQPSGPQPPSAHMPQPPRRMPQPPGMAAAHAQSAAQPAQSPEQSVAEVATHDEDPEAEWRQVYEQFLALKQQCGEPTEGFTYDKFRRTLVKNRDAIVARHGVSAVKFSVYIKENRAALKASPVR